MRGAHSYQSFAGRSCGDALVYRLPEQPSKCRATVLRDCRVIRHWVKQVQSKVTAQGNVYLDALFNLPLRRDAIYVSHQQIFH
ncbi:hypothetical protein OBV_38160 [Oscillibacter valericigenes Sjm18-20]|nr:hypothetical protein OBV_38160 [Oscillibacter valericigenes Sjm18-20]